MDSQPADPVDPVALAGDDPESGDDGSDVDDDGATVSADSAPVVAPAPIVAPPIPAAPRARGAARSDDEILADQIGKLLPTNLIGQPGAELLGTACLVYGIDPKSRSELLSWRYYPANPDTGAREYIRLVTAGGKALAWPIDDSTTIVLQDVFRLHKMDRSTGVPFVAPLPPDLTLPRPAVTGQVPVDAGHQYPGGYLKMTDEERAKRAARQRATS